MADKYKVTMRSVTLTASGTAATLEAVDYVPSDILDVYVADARTRWQYVVVASRPVEDDAETAAPAHLEGKTPADFEKYGNASTPENALDEHLEQRDA